MIGRRNFLKYGSLLSAGAFVSSTTYSSESQIPRRLGGARLKLSLNAYSFNRLLRNGEMDLFDLLDYCAREGYDAVDPTAYYFPGYPEVPSDRFLFDFKRRASILGLDISGTGIRNDFTVADPAKRSADRALVERWARASSKMGAPVIRVFAGKGQEVDHSREQKTKWMIEELKVCADIGKQTGVMMALQNHNDFLKTADQIIHVMESVQSEWLGLQLDIGSLTVNDPYEEMEKLVPYAITWQIKEEVTIKGEQVPTDLEKVFLIAKRSGYRGYLPLETLGPEAPERLPEFYARAREALQKVM
jgi:sugar phosphate isomerase/epimerase